MSALDTSMSSAKSKLSKLRKSKKDNASSQSLVSNSSETDDLPPSRNLSVVDSTDRLSEPGRKSGESRRRSSDATSTRRLSKLVPGRLKRRKSSKDELPTNSKPGDDGLEERHDSGLIRNTSDISLRHNDSGRSSLLTDDSDTEGRPLRPTLSTHNSHAGYLTLSSPQIHAQTSDSVVPSAASASVPTLHISEPPADEPATTDTTHQPTERARSVPPAGQADNSGQGSDLAAHPDQDISGLGIVKANVNGRPASISGASPSQPLSVEPVSRRPLSAIDTSARPQTPPNTVTTPSTLVTPPTPTLQQGGSPPKRDRVAPEQSSPKITLSPSGPTGSSSSLRSRKVAGIGSSKLSNAITAGPLSPTLEETKTPGGTLTSPIAGSGFFSSVFSAAQNAATQLNSTFNAANQAQRARQLQSKQSQDTIGSEEVIGGLQEQAQEEVEGEPVRPLAVETLGKGELNLGHLGISDSTDVSPMHSTTDLAQGDRSSEESAQKAEETAAARAVSAAYEKPVQSAIAQATGRPPSIASASSRGAEQSPARAAVNNPTNGDIKRSGSVRSRLSGRRQRRHRGSSTTTGGTLAAAIAASTNTLANPANATSGPGHRLTGFAVASSKRNKDFHQLFRSVPEDEYLIEDYSAALQRDILLHGRLYISEGHVCFSSNILGWVTNLVISFDEVVSMEKRNTAVVFPNAIAIQTLQAKNTFASFVARDSTYELLIGIWKINHPNLKTTANMASIDDSAPSVKKENESNESDDESEEGSDEIYDEDAEGEDDNGSYTEPGNPSIAGSDVGDLRTLSRKTSVIPDVSTTITNGSTPKGLETADAVVTGAAVSADFPGPPLHGPTECADQDTHYDRPLTDTTIPAPLGKVYNLLYGPASSAFMKKWLVEDQKSRELSYEDDKFGLDDAHKQIVYSYIKPLNAPVGPKQTKCITTCKLEAFDLEKAVTIDCGTQTPDVPSGSIFVTKTRYCLMWGPNNTTRMVANCTIEWSGKSWLRGPIEKGANDGQTAYVKDLLVAINAAVTTKPPVKGTSRVKGKGKRRRETFDTAGTEARRTAPETSSANASANWGLLEPLRGLLSPVTSLLGPLITSQVIIAVLVLLLARSWFFGGRSVSGVGYPLSGADRLMAYERMWQKEEDDLWDWLEDRVGMNGALPGSSAQDDRGGKARQKVLRSKEMASKLAESKTGQHQLDEAIRTTEERLAALKDVVDAKREPNKKKK